MRAMVLERPGLPLVLREKPQPEPDEGEVVVRVECCAVCRTDLHVVDGELQGATLPVIPGHQIAGVVARSRSAGFREGDRIGIPWLAWTCGSCAYCRSGRENLCDSARFTGYTVDGGYAGYTAADARFCFRLPESYTAEEAAPLLCGGLIGFRAFAMCGAVQRVGFYGFGSAAQVITQLATADGREVYAFTRPGDAAAQDYARSLGAAWAGGSDESVPLDAAVIFAPAGRLVLAALRNVVKGGTVVCAGIHMSDIPSFPYELLWGERTIRSVANLTRADGVAFFERIAPLRIETRRTSYPLEEANAALDALRSGAVTGTAVLTID